jgi:tetratricopeptide (TPR) repeat protein
MRPILILLFYLPAISVLAQNNDEQIARKTDSLISSYQFQKAVDVLSQGDTLNMGILLQLGNCNSRLGISKTAIHLYEKILSMDSSNITALNQLGQLYTREGDFHKSLDAYSRLLRIDSVNSYHYKQAAYTASRLDMADVAIMLYAEALNFNPKDVETYQALGTRYIELKEFRQADSLIEKALAVDPQSKNLLMLKVRSAFEQDKDDVVISTINNLLERADTTASYARYLGISYFNLRDYRKVKTCMEFLVKNNYEGESIYYYLGVAARELGNFKASIDYLKLAVQKSISENIQNYYTQLGQSYEEIGNYPMAIQSYHQAHNSSRKGILLYHLAHNYDVYYKNKSKALEYYKKYLNSEDTTRIVRDFAKRRMRDIGKF